MGYLANSYRQLMKDRDLEEREERIAALEAAESGSNRFRVKYAHDREKVASSLVVRPTGLLVCRLRIPVRSGKKVFTLLGSVGT